MTETANMFAENQSYYVNPSYISNIKDTIAVSTDTETTEYLSSMLSVPSAYWLDVKDKLSGIVSCSIITMYIHVFATCEHGKIWVSKK